jgi:DNA-binding FadR family transcriptional regulator
MEMERTEETLIKLRQLLSGDGLAINGRIPPERVLANELGVGRRSLRRALDVLEKEGRVSRRQGRGTFVEAAVSDGAIPFDRIMEHTNPLEVIEVRLSVEPAMARLAAIRASQADIRKLQRLAEETRDAGDPLTYQQADEQFHRAIAEAARNALFLAVFDTLRTSQCDAGWRRLGENAHCYKRQSVYADFHREICDAIALREGERAHEAMFRHLSDVQRHVYRHIFPRDSSEQ